MMGEPMNTDNEVPVYYDDLYIGPNTERVLTRFDVHQLIRKFEDNTIRYSDLSNFWKDAVPAIFCPTPVCFTVDPAIRPAVVKKYLLKPLEDFMCKFEHDDLLSFLDSNVDAPPVCGRLFKVGEPTYNCRECAMDATCVLCVECFSKSSHRHHKYKMQTSGGGGCCDCGDEEAWTSDPYCGVHLPSEKSSRAPQVLPPDAIERIRFVFTSVLQYAFKLLTFENPSVPGDLAEDSSEMCDISEFYCTVLYNDEVHTFEQVINILLRVIKCTQRQAVEYVTGIDREGRAIVKCANFKTCLDLKSYIEQFISRHGTKPLKVLVMQSKMIAHQLFAIRILVWVQMLLKPSFQLRKLFAEVVTNKNGDNLHFLSGMLVRDSLLWKSARLCWHRLFITGMLMDYTNKKIFATMFTKTYPIILNGFINDDHEHLFSVASLSVQIFTVPTIAHYLIEKEDAIITIMKPFLSVCAKKCNKYEKLTFDRNVSNSKFKRAIYSLYDIKYLLTFVPTEFTDQLRKQFIHGVFTILDLFTYMQGMDSVVRQVGQHMEYEPEWESAFNLHIKLAPIITLILKWCSADSYLTVRSFRIVLAKLHDDINKTKLTFDPITVNNITVAALSYDVATQPVSIHWPLSRFLAGLSLCIEKFSLDFSNLAANRISTWELIEPVLRTRVLIAQVQAGMWRRNGYSLANQIYFYTNVKCRNQMLDKDIILLQLGCTLVPSDHFIITLLYKFALLNWVNPDFEKMSLKNSEDDTIRQTVYLIEEFLLLLINIIGERFSPGVGQVNQSDALKREIMHQLCIKPMSHSELDKTLHDDVTHETGLETVINDIAVFKKPSHANSKGIYELKPEYMEMYDVFFYHYSREELSKSEENMRKHNKNTIGYECCPPPKLPLLTSAFTKINNLLTCDMMILIMKLVLDRCLNFCARSFSEPQVHKVLHLIGYALHEENEGKLSDSFTAKASAKDIDLPGLLEKIVSNPRVEAHRDLIKWILRKFVTVANKGVVTESNIPMECSSVEKEEKQSRSRIAAERKAKVMAQMAAMQKNFMKDNQHFFEEEMLSNNPVELDSSPSPKYSDPIALGPSQTVVKPTYNSYVCILCQEEQEVTVAGRALVLAAFVQRSAVLCKDRALNPAEDFKTTLHRFLTPNCGPAIHTSSCGHIMHRACWRRYFENVLSKENRRPFRLRQPSSYDVEKHEYLCPLCECLCNTVIPILPMLSLLPNLKDHENLLDTSFSDWCDASIEAINLSKISKVSSGSEVMCLSVPDDEDTTHTAVQLDTVSQSINPDVLEAPSEGQSSPTTDENLNSTAIMNEPEPNDELPETVEFISSPDIFEALAHSNPSEENPNPAVYSNSESSSSDSFIPGTPCTSNITSHTLLGCKEKQTHVEPILSEDIKEMIMLFAHSSFKKMFNVSPVEGDPLLPLPVFQSCAYTIKTVEQCLRANNKPLFGGMPARQKDCLSALVKLSAVLGYIWKSPSTINLHASKLVEMVVDNKVPECGILDWDSFSLLVTLSCVVPSMISLDPVPVPTGTNLEFHAFTLMLFSTIVQVMAAIDVPKSNTEEQGDSKTETLKSLIHTLCTAPEKVNELTIDKVSVWNHIKKEAVPFLRCAALFFYFLTDVPPCEELQTVGGDTFENLLAYLGLPATYSELINNDDFIIFLQKWSWQICKLEKHDFQSKVKLLKDMTTINSLIQLPDDYSDLINTVSLFTCPNSDREDSRNPTMCLVCGEILCSQTYCCQKEVNKSFVGACNYHCYTCGQGVGMFLRIRECEILMLASPNRGAFSPAPYLDEYGEHDPGLTRGNPLKLCPEKYKQIQLLWLSHSIYEHIARSLESSTSPLNIQWQHL